MKTYYPVAESYFIIEETSPMKLTLAVEKKLGEHWTPQGGVVIDSEGRYLQVMVYWERSEEDKKKSKAEADKTWAKLAENLKIPSEALDKAIKSEES